MNRRDDRGSWYLLTGLVLGFIIGLVYVWLFNPVSHVDITPASLSEEYKVRQRALIAAAYQANPNIGRAKARLELLEDEDMYTTLARQAQEALSREENSPEAQALGLLSVALGQGEAPQETAAPSVPPAASPTYTSAPATPTSIQEFTPTPPPATLTNTPDPVTSTASLISDQVITATQVVTPTVTITPTATTTSTPTITPVPSRTPTPTPGGPFSLESSEQICEPVLQQPLIQVFALNAARQPVPGAEVVVTWNGGEQHFFTGLKPELSPGYADFIMTPGIVYTLHLAGGGELVSNLVALECEDGWGAWKLTFIQP